ncbi:MAG: hydrogenase maturation nickel metallochaperone HypA [Planctomycetaceae bacterium]
MRRRPMHEYSLVRSLLNQVAEVMASHRACAVERVRVEIGPLSGVEPELVSLAFEQLVGETPCRGAVLTIERVPLSCCCRDCDAQFDLVGFDFRCPHCESRSVQVIRVDEFRLLDVTVCAEPEVAPSPAPGTDP